MKQIQNQLANRVTTRIANNPWKSLAIGIALVLGLAPGLGRVTANFTHTAFFTDDDPLLQQFNAFERQFGNDDAIVVVVDSPSGIFDVDSARLLQELTERMWRVPEVIRVDSLANFQWVHAAEGDIEVEPLIPDDVPLTAELLRERKRIALGQASGRHFEERIVAQEVGIVGVLVAAADLGHALGEQFLHRMVDI